MNFYPFGQQYGGFRSEQLQANAFGMFASQHQPQVLMLQPPSPVAVSQPMVCWVLPPQVPTLTPTGNFAALGTSYPTGSRPVTVTPSTPMASQHQTLGDRLLAAAGISNLNSEEAEAALAKSIEELTALRRLCEKPPSPQKKSTGTDPAELVPVVKIEQLSESDVSASEPGPVRIDPAVVAAKGRGRPKLRTVEPNLPPPAGEFSPHVLAVLEKEFAKNCNPSTADRVRMAIELSISPTKVEQWFREKRTANKGSPAELVPSFPSQKLFFSEEQKQALREFAYKNPNANVTQLRALARNTNLSVDQIKRWIARYFSPSPGGRRGGGRGRGARRGGRGKAKPSFNQPMSRALVSDSLLPLSTELHNNGAADANEPVEVDNLNPLICS